MNTTETICKDCGGNCDAILKGLKESLGIADKRLNSERICLNPYCQTLYCPGCTEGPKFLVPDCPDCGCVQDGNCLCIPSKPAIDPANGPKAVVGVCREDNPQDVDEAYGPGTYERLFPETDGGANNDNN